MTDPAASNTVAVPADATTIRLVNFMPHDRGDHGLGSRGRGGGRRPCTAF